MARRPPHTYAVGGFSWFAPLRTGFVLALVASVAMAGPVAADPIPRPDLVDRSWPANPPWDACPAPRWSAGTYSGEPGEGRRVLIIGDSLTRESRIDTASRLRDSGWTPTFRCWGSRRLDWGLDQIARARSLDQLPGWVVMALGTNDVSWETQATTEARVRRILDRLGPRRQVLWVDLHINRSSWLNSRAAWFNAMMRDFARTRPNLTIVPWHRVATKAGIRGFDGIHYGNYGYRLRARTLVDAIDTRARKLNSPVSTAPNPEVSE